MPTAGDHHHVKAMDDRQENSSWRVAASESMRCGWSRRVYQAVALPWGDTPWSGMAGVMAQSSRRPAGEAVMDIAWAVLGRGG